MDVNHAFDILELIIVRALDKVANWAGQARENSNMFPIIQFNTKWLYVPVNYKKKAWLYTSDTWIYATQHNNNIYTSTMAKEEKT